ncbi:MAG: PASTA domain-containing protein [Oscillospiraceae bacterium]|nr:PASTA domain-containing protein [Oscillospiraceae bacterium]
MSPYRKNFYESKAAGGRIDSTSRRERGERIVQQKKKASRRASRTIRLRTLGLMVFFGILTFTALFFKIYDLTINRHEEMQSRAAKQQTQSVTLSASRGTIYDRNGKTLAISATADTVFLDPAAIQARIEELEKERAKKIVEGLKEGETLPLTGDEYKDLIATTLAPLLEIDEQTIRDKMEKTWSQYEILKKKVEREVGDQIRAFISDNVTGTSIKGIHMQSDAKRYYPYSNLASHVIGFLNSDSQGAYGLEAIYNEDLEGSSGLTISARDARNREIMFQYEQYYDAENGNSLQLTIDSTIQYYVERGLEEMISKYGASNGAAGIVMDVNSGALLAIASSPSYDLNAPREIYDSLLKKELNFSGSQGEASEEKSEEDSEEKSEENTGEDSDKSEAPPEKTATATNLGDLQLKQWRNKAVNDTYEPGSTYKILTLAAALEEGLISPASTFQCNGSVQVDGWTMKCSKLAGHGLQDLATATANSCNPAFINIGLSIGTERYYQYMRDFGLMEKTGVDLQGEAVGVAASASDFKPIDLASYAFGQNFTVTPLQMIAAQAACINGGYLYTPYVVDKVLDDKGNVISQHDATPVRQVISEDTSVIVRQILEGVVANGTGKNGQVAGYRVGGKTGTADQGKTGTVVVSFVCFAPADDPQIIMLLTMDTPSRNTGTYVSGGNMVAPTSSLVMGDILPYLGYTAQYSSDELSAVDATVPYVVGMNEVEAAAKLAEYGFQSYRKVGDGDVVTDQTPAGGGIVPVSAEIILYMGAEKSSDLCKVPNVIGKTAAQANKALVNAGLIMKTVGVTEQGGVIRAISQSHAEGSEVAAGTVITVQMGQSSTTAD